jgi:CTP:molybdopterin cytidylyltransferase MocA
MPALDVTAGRIASIVLAAGAGLRFGGGKQLAPLRGKPLLAHALAAAAAGPADAIFLVLGAEAETIEGALDLGTTIVVRCEDWERGPGASLRAGIEALPEDVATALVTLGDEPFISPQASRRLLEARRPGLRALRATYGDRPGHPVLIERELFPALRAIQSTARPAELLRDAGIATVACDDLGHPADVDTPEQLAALELPTEPSGPDSEA